MKKIIITGNVGKDPEMRSDQNGGQFATFSVGVAVGTKQTPKTDWVEISANGKLAEIVRSFVRKGTKVLIEGFPSVNAYINRENKPIGILRVYANNIELLSKKENPSDEESNNEDAAYTIPDIEEVSQTVSSGLDNTIPF
jgi:single-strand DNA-binding protein